MNLYKKLIADIKDTPYVISSVVPSTYNTPGIVKIDKDTLKVDNGLLSIDIDKLKREVVSIVAPTISNIKDEGLGNPVYIRIFAKPKRNGVKIASYTVDAPGIGINNATYTNINSDNSIYVILTNVALTPNFSTFVTASAIDEYGNHSASTTVISHYVSSRIPAIISPESDAATYQSAIQVEVTGVEDAIYKYSVINSSGTELYSKITTDVKNTITWSDLTSLTDASVSTYLSSTMKNQLTDGSHIVFDDFTVYDNTIYGISGSSVYKDTTNGFVKISSTDAGTGTIVTSNNTVLLKILNDCSYYYYYNNAWSAKQIPSGMTGAPVRACAVNDVIFVVVGSTIYYNQTLYANPSSWMVLPTQISNLIDIVYFNDTYYFLSVSSLYYTTVLSNSLTLLITDSNSEFRSIAVMRDKVAVINKPGIMKYISNTNTVTTSTVISDTKSDWYFLNFTNPFLIAISSDNSHCISIDDGITWTTSASTIFNIPVSLKHIGFDSYVFYMTNTGLMRRYFASITDLYTLMVQYVFENDGLGVGSTRTFRYELDTIYPYMVSGAVFSDKALFTMDMKDTIFYGGFNDNTVFKF